ncbi:MAG: UDP-N-acetylmuramoyl-tripeptide--D-alanyl-D-alanine ligase, partial [Gaiellales bacterium]
MIPLTAQDVAAAVGGDCSSDAVVTGLAIDSRRVRAGDLFVALPGTRTDGLRFVEAALDAGAVLAIVPRGHGDGLRRIEAADTVEALGLVAREVRNRSQARVVGITGSTGKTSTKDILTALLEPHVRVVASHENENTEIGVPLTLGRIEPDTAVVVAELAMRGLGQIRYLAGICLPDVALITGVGPVHLEILGDLENVARAKAEILARLPASGAAVVPFGERSLEPHMERLRCAVVTFGEAEGADSRLLDLSGGRAEIELRGRTITMPVNFTSRHNGVNLAAATAVYDALGLPLDLISSGSAGVRFSRWRGEEIPLEGGGVLIADCYNANPTSMRAALDHLVSAADLRRRVAILGDMAELGSDAPAYHREIGRLARELGIHQVIAIGPLARSYG